MGTVLLTVCEKMGKWCEEIGQCSVTLIDDTWHIQSKTEHSACLH